MLPFKPSYLPFFSTILIIPAIPSGSYFADGEVMTSTLSMRDAGMLSTSFPPSPVRLGLPFTSIFTLGFPLKVTSPSWSTTTMGTLLSTSSAVPLSAMISSEELYISLSVSNSKMGLSSITFTASNSMADS